MILQDFQNLLSIKFNYRIKNEYSISNFLYKIRSVTNRVNEFFMRFISL